LGEEKTLSFLIALKIFTMKMISQHKTTAHYPHYQQNLPNFHAILPMNVWWINTVLPAPIST